MRLPIILSGPASPAPRPPCRRWRAACTVAVLCAAVLPAAAQETRREQLEQMRAERARQLQPDERGKLESALVFAERSRIVERVAGSADGWYPVLGSVTRGGGFAGGVGYRRHFSHERLLFNANTAFSLRGYRSVRVEVRAPRVLDDHLEIGGRFRDRYFPQEDYYGPGANSLETNRVSYLFQEQEVAAFATLRPGRWFSVSAQLAHLSPEIDTGRDSRYPSIEERFTEAQAPGLTRQPAFLESGIFFDADYRDQPGNPRSGGRYALLLLRYDDREDGAYDFTRLSTLIEQNIPIFDKKRVFALRLTTHHADAQDGATIPFYYLPSVGGKDTIRAYGEFRFRDANALVFNAEYRWEAFSGLDMALFYDMGNAKPTWRAMSIRDMRKSYGLAFRFNTYEAVFLRAEVAFGGDEGRRAFVSFGTPFKFERFIR